jgi:cysteine-rich repeat protein
MVTRRVHARFRPSRRPTIAAWSLGLSAVLCTACGPGGTASDSGTTPICGDGNQDPDELCDDGNQLAGDGCSPECLPSGMPVDCVDLLVQDDPDDVDTVMALLPLADGTFVAAGERDALKDDRGWLGRFEPSGTQRWLVDATSVDPDIDYVGRLAGDEQAGIWALAAGPSLANALLIRFDQDGNALSTVVVESELGAVLAVSDIEVTASGVWLAGEMWGEETKRDAWVGLYSPTQDAVQDVLHEDHLGYNDSILAVGRDGEGVAVVATVSTSPNSDEDVLLTAQTDILVIWFDPQGNELRRTTVGPSPEPEWARRADRITADGEGRWFVGGHLQPLDFPQEYRAWAAQVDGEWAWTSETPSTYWGDMTGVDDGVVVATNHTLAHDSGELFSQGWLTEFGADGAARWDFGVVGDDVAGYKDYSHWALRIDFNGQLRTAGTVWPEDDGKLKTVRSCLITR